VVSFFANLWISFLAGLFAPIGAVCVLPLYPGFLAYLSNQITNKERSPEKKIMVLGLIVTSGVISSMFLFGLIFTQLLQTSLTKAIGIISPIAFSILGIVSILMIFNFNLGKFLPKVNAPLKKNPCLTSFIFGFFFGAIVLPCNPSSLIVLFAISSSTTSFIANLFNFILFGIGMALPLLVFSILSATKSTTIIKFLTTNTRKINLIAGLIMLGVSLYYLIFVFKVLG
jgi:cytochrome c-type biogenesis protein